MRNFKSYVQAISKFPNINLNDSFANEEFCKIRIDEKEEIIENAYEMISNICDLLKEFIVIIPLTATEPQKKIKQIYCRIVQLSSFFITMMENQIILSQEQQNELHEAIEELNEFNSFIPYFISITSTTMVRFLGTLEEKAKNIHNKFVQIKEFIENERNILISKLPDQESIDEITTKISITLTAIDKLEIELIFLVADVDIIHKDPKKFQAFKLWIQKFQI